MLLIMILSFVSSAYIPIDTLPPFLEFFANINPVTHLIEAFKSIAYEGVINRDVLLSVFSSLVVIGVFIPLTLNLFKKNIK